MNRRRFMALGIALPWLTACADMGRNIKTAVLPGIGLVVEDQLAPGAAVKEGIQGISDTGKELFSHAILTAAGGGISSYGGASVPRWVDVTWRKGKIDMDFRTGRWIGGTVIGNYRVQVLSRIPAKVFAYAREKRDRAIRLRFRIKDDGVLFGWDVQEPRGGAWGYEMRGGDF